MPFPMGLASVHAYLAEDSLRTDVFSRLGWWGYSAGSLHYPDPRHQCHDHRSARIQVECHDKYILVPDLEIAAPVGGHHHRREDDQRTFHCESHSTAPACSPPSIALAMARNKAACECACSSHWYNKLTAQNINLEEI